MYLKRHKTPKNWPVYRKGTKYVVKPRFNLESGVPLVIAMRDLLKIATNRKEVRKAIFSKQILINNKFPTNEKSPILLFDTLSIIPMKKNYRLDLSDKGKFVLREISTAESDKKTTKVIDKKILKGKRIQLNFIDGRNFISDIKCSVNDSALINFKDKKIEKCLPFKEGSRAIIFSGKHSGKKGTIKTIDNKKKTLELESEGKEGIHALIKQTMIIE